MLSHSSFAGASTFSVEMPNIFVFVCSILPMEIFPIVALVVIAVIFILYKWRRFIIFVICLPIWRETCIERLVGHCCLVYHDSGVFSLRDSSPFSIVDLYHRYLVGVCIVPNVLIGSLVFLLYPPWIAGAFGGSCTEERQQKRNDVVS